VSGGLVLLRKELLESWRTLRLPIVTGLFLVVGLTSPLLARFLPEIIEAAGGAELGSIQIPTPVAADAASQLWKNLAQFGAIAAIVLAMSSVAAEKERGTAAFVLSKTVSRGAFLASKVVAIGAVLGLGVVLATAVAWFYTAVLFEPLPVAGWVAFAALAWLGWRSGARSRSRAARSLARRLRRRASGSWASWCSRSRRPSPRSATTCRVGSPSRPLRSRQACPRTAAKSPRRSSGRSSSSSRRW